MNTGNKISGAREDGFAAMIEAETAQIPSSAYLAAALVSMADHAALFFGAVGRSIFAARCLQQNGQATRIGRRISTKSTKGQSCDGGCLRFTFRINIDTQYVAAYQITGRSFFFWLGEIYFSECFMASAGE